MTGVPRLQATQCHPPTPHLITGDTPSQRHARRSPPTRHDVAHECTSILYLLLLFFLLLLLVIVSSVATSCRGQNKAFYHYYYYYYFLRPKQCRLVYSFKRTRSKMTLSWTFIIIIILKKGENDVVLALSFIPAPFSGSFNPTEPQNIALTFIML